jgi:hypothetical protein
MKSAKLLHMILVLICTTLISGFGCRDRENSGSNSNAQNATIGTIRFKPLSLAGKVTTYAGSAGASGTTDGIGRTASLLAPTSVTTDGSNLYVTATTIRKIEFSTGKVTTLAGTGAITGSADGVGIAASFKMPMGITTDGKKLYVADSGNHTIRKIVVSTGAVTTFAGTAGNYGSTDGIGTSARFNVPNGITTDGKNLYVTEAFNNIIRKIAISTQAVSTLAGTAGTEGSDDGIGAAARFKQPAGITTDGVNLFVADSGDHTIRKIVISTGAVTTLVGSAGEYGSTDGVGAAARFSGPTGITTDGNNLYVTDSGNDTIRKIVISTKVVTTLAGTALSPGSTDGIGPTAEFNLPVGITTDGKNLYVAEMFNRTIRKIQ